eukprot:IDg15800t1
MRHNNEEGTILLQDSAAEGQHVSTGEQQHDSRGEPRLPAWPPYRHRNNPNPVWNASGYLEVAHEVDALEIRVKAAKRKGVLSAMSKISHLSMLSIPAHVIAEKTHISGWFELTSYCKKVTTKTSHEDPSEDEHKHSKHGIDSLGEIR